MITFFGLVGFAVILTIGLAMLMPMILMSPPTLTRPVDCEIGVECFIQNYVDLDKREGSAADYHCGAMTYDGHTGTDFRTRSLVEMRRGVKVLAAADGTVLRTRDSVEDASIRSEDAPNIEGSECGNGLVIRHSNGFETQYCHLKRGSLKVKAQDEVKRGQELGEIGLSGQTEFPHLHFALRNKDGEMIDPFAGKLGDISCGKTETFENLWHPQYRKEMAYAPTALLSAGFTDTRPSAEAARDGQHREQSLMHTSDPLIFWVDVMGLKAGDSLLMQLYDPDRVNVVNYEKNIEKPQAQYFQFIGSRLQNNTPWKLGTYTGSVRLVREKTDVIHQSFELKIEAPEAPALPNDDTAATIPQTP